MVSYDDYTTDGFEISEIHFDATNLGKWESILCQGNGYMGVRAAHEERYPGERRNLFVAGTYNRFDEHEQTELPNGADLIGLDLGLNGEPFNLIAGTIHDYRRTLNLNNGELGRWITWSTEATGRMHLEFMRFVSLRDLHLFCRRVVVTPLERDVEVVLTTGIDGRMTNSGVSHFSYRSMRAPDEGTLQLMQTTTQSRVAFAFALCDRLQRGREDATVRGHAEGGRRLIRRVYRLRLAKGESLELEQAATVHTDRDRDVDLSTGESLAAVNLAYLRDRADRTYEEHLSASTEAWNAHVWSGAPVHIESERAVDLRALRFARYHLTAITPAHDRRMNIGAKGLSGEGYKGHVFWDTEIFMLPYFTLTTPEVARSLLEYRGHCLPTARRKANENGYRGAMFPWESAWIDDGETTPEYGDVDVHTGEQIRIWCGAIEHHITADVALGVWHYFMASDDQEFMDAVGYEIIFEAAAFWASRLEWDEAQGVYGITDVIGPDEYKEHVDNNAYTNYGAWWCLANALNCAESLRAKRRTLYDRFDRELGLAHAVDVWRDRVSTVYLPKPNGEGIVPQDDTYLSLDQIDLSPYRSAQSPGAIFKELTLAQVGKLQVSKQADVVLLMVIFDELFDARVRKVCLDYYESRTLHDSSLSLSVHSLLAADLGETERAYEFFRRACMIDMGPNMKSSDAGIHAASLGGIWQCVVFGFGGFRPRIDGVLRIRPRLPKAWSELSYSVRWKRRRLDVCVDHRRVHIRVDGDEPAHLDVAGASYTVHRELDLAYEPAAVV